MRRGWVTYLLAAGLVGMLAVLGVFQYRWVRQISEADSEKAHQRVEEQSENFANDFNREIQNAYFNFQTDPDSWKNQNWTQFNERYTFWQQNSHYPDLVSGFYFFEANGSGPVLAYDVTARSFRQVEPSTEMQDVRRTSTDPKTFRAIYDTSTLVIPVLAPEQPKVRSDQTILRVRSVEEPDATEMHFSDRYGYLVEKLDQGVITGRVLPDLTNKYFGDGEFKPAVVDAGGGPVYNTIGAGSPDAARPLYDLTSNNFVFFANQGLLSSLPRRKATPADGGVVLKPHLETRSFSRVESVNNGNKVVRVEVGGGGSPRTAAFTTSLDDKQQHPWQLQVQHVSGSLDAYIASTLRRNLAFSFGILILLAAAVVGILIISLRARRLAQRQIDFVSSVSHEFRTPLAVIYSAAENLEDGITREQGQVSQYGRLIKGEGRKLTAMVEQILDFAGANAGKRRYTFSQTSLSEVVRIAVDECAGLARERDVSVDTSIGEGLTTLNADRGALTQAVQNLIANGIKYSDPGSPIMVSVYNGGQTVKISIEDKGIGISPSDLRRIFEPFYRSKQVVDAQIHGNGLGLSLVKQIVTAHGGTVRAESEPERGSKFTIELPQ